MASKKKQTEGVFLLPEGDLKRRLALLAAFRALGFGFNQSLQR